MFALLPALLLFELVVTLLINRSYFSEIVKQYDDVDEESNRFSSYALTLAGMAFSGFATVIALTDRPAELDSALRVLAVSIALLFVSYETRELTLTKRKWITIQEKTLSYGFLSLFAGTLALYDAAIPSSSSMPLIIALIFVLIIRTSTVYRQLKMLRKM